MNKVILLGRMARDPEIKYVQAATQTAEPLAVCRFTVAVERPYSKNRKESDPAVDFINCVCFGKRGENIGQYFRKGNRIAVTGRLQVSNYIDQQNIKKYSTDVVIETFEFCETKTNSKNPANGENGEAAEYNDMPYEEAGDETLPF